MTASPIPSASGRGSANYVATSYCAEAAPGGSSIVFESKKIMLLRGSFFLLVISLAANSASGETALAALKVLPKGAARHLARIEARDGSPIPERWHILVHDEQAENGLREYVVAKGELAASREISQFAESLKPEDVIGAAAIRIDSDRAARKAQRYAEANNAEVAAMNYELRKDPTTGAPVWKVTCVNALGTPGGAVTVAATEGGVVAHEGFAAEPANLLTKSGSSRREKTSVRELDPGDRPELRTRAVRPDSNSRTASSRPSRRSPAPRPLEPGTEPIPVRRAEPVDAAPDQDEPERRPSAMRRATETGRRIVRGLLPF